ncbi:MAG: hypothetical protein ACHQE6_00385 [Solirubrobacterales bacterium]
MTITIPAELVSLLRDGLRFDLHGQLDSTAALLEPRDRKDIRAEVDGGLARANGARALLNVVGWIEPVDEAFPVEVDVREHRDTLLRALLTRIESECSVREDREASDAERAEAKVRIRELGDLIARVEESDR